MSHEYFENDNRIIKIEINPFHKPKQKFKMMTPKMGPNGRVVNQTGKGVSEMQDVPNLARTPGTTTVITPCVTAKGLETGLDVFVPNPYKEDTVFKFEWAERILKGKERVKLQHLLEYEHGVPFNYYTNQIPFEAIPSNKENKTFFEKPESRPQLSNNTTFLHLNNPIHRVHYYTLLNHPLVAKSYADLQDGQSSAIWYIVDENEKERVTLTKIEKQTKAAAALEALKDSADEAIIHMAKYLELPGADVRNLTREKASLLVYNYYNGNEDSWKRFMEAYEMWKDAPRRAYFFTGSNLFDYIKTNIISYRNGKYTYIQPASGGKPSEVHSRNSKDEMIRTFLLDPAYQDEVKMIEEQYAEKVR